MPQVQALPEVLHPLAQTVERMVEFADAIATMDAVVISGGGNLNSRYGWLLYERAAAVRAAEHAGVPVYVTGQSLGPVLNPEDAQVLERMLRVARSVTVREHSSLAWCRERGIDARLSVDDATDYLPASPARTLHYTEGISASQALDNLPERYVCVTVNECTEQQAQQIARLLDSMWREHGYAPVFLSHFGDPQNPESGDIHTHQRIAEQLSPSTPATLLPILHADQSVTVHRGAAFTLTSRYHPAVFSAAAGIPVLALAPDAFTQMRVGGALNLYGLGEFTLPLGMLAGGVPELMVAAALRHAAVASDARHTELLEVLRTERAYLLAQILAPNAENHGKAETQGEAETPAPFPTVEQVPALPEPLGATVRAARDLLPKPPSPRVSSGQCLTGRTPGMLSTAGSSNVPAQSAAGTARAVFTGHTAPKKRILSPLSLSHLMRHPPSLTPPSRACWRGWRAASAAKLRNGGQGCVTGARAAVLELGFLGKRGSRAGTGRGFSHTCAQHCPSLLCTAHAPV